MNQQTDHAIAKLQQLIPAVAHIHVPRIEYAITALLASAEREQVKDRRIEMLEARLREQEKVGE